MIDFISWQKIPRLFKDIVVTEKIDGTNGQIVILEDPTLPVIAGSRTRWLTDDQGTLGEDNYGFGRWVLDNEETLKGLGPGRYYGEWFGRGIQRNYGLKDRRFALFDPRTDLTPELDDIGVTRVPILARGLFSEKLITDTLIKLEASGSVLVPGFMKPEGIAIYHTAANRMFKVPFDPSNKEGK